MSSRRYDHHVPSGRFTAYRGNYTADGGNFATDGLGEDGGESTVMITPSGQLTRQAGPSAAPSSGGGTDWGAVISSALPVALSVYGQQQLTRLNVARINAGQQPLTGEQYTSTYRLPAAEVQIGATAQTQKLLMYGALGVLGIIALRAVKII